MTTPAELKNKLDLEIRQLLDAASRDDDSGVRGNQTRALYYADANLYFLADRDRNPLPAEIVNPIYERIIGEINHPKIYLDSVAAGPAIEFDHFGLIED
jgi:hypothetical protein